MEPDFLTQNNEYTKDEIESVFNTNFGARIKGITLRRTPQNEPYIIIFSREDSPYEDRSNEDGSFYYDGEGQQKDQELTSANKAMINAIEDDTPIYGFRQTKTNSKWRYTGQLAVLDYAYLNKNGYMNYEFHLAPYASNVHKQLRKHQRTPRIDPYLLDKQYHRLKQLLESKDGHKFTSFSQSPYMKENEDYKKELHSRANTHIDIDNWESNQIGTGKILRNVIDAIEIQGNNLVFTSQHSHTQKGAPHRALLDAQEQNDTYKIEEALYELYKGIADDQEVFTKLVDLVGKRYGVLSYLFFLKNIRRYMPVAPENFDYVFNDMLEINFKTSHKCSWENYETYNELVNQVKEFLHQKIEEDVSLIDTHSFLWMIGTQLDETEVEQEPISKIEATEVFVDTEYVFNNMEFTKEPSDSTPASIEVNNQRNIIKGAKGERYVLNYEKNRLISEGKPDLADKVKPVSEDNSSLGYDILSYSAEGNELYIEVKTSTAHFPDRLSFTITRNEYRKSQSLPNYMIYAVCSVDDDPHIKYIREPFQGISNLFEKIAFSGGIATAKNMQVNLKLKQ